MGALSIIYNYYKNSKIVWKVVGYGIPTALLGAYVSGKVILVIDEVVVRKIIFFLIPIELIFSFMPKKDNNITYQPNRKDIMLVLPLRYC